MKNSVRGIDLSYRFLDPQRIIETIELLGNRIEDRFPGAGLGRVCKQLLLIAGNARERSEWIGRPIIWLRVTIWLLLGVIVLGLGGTIYSFLDEARVTDRIHLDDFFAVVQGLEAGLNEMVMVAVGIFFLFTLETRIKRRRALNAIRELRSLVHIIDMHQLTKDPERLLKRWVGAKHSPEQAMTQFELQRYLDYCSEMLALAGKIAAMYVQHFDDEIAVASVNEVETLSNALSRKIWQKIMILHSFETADELVDELPVVDSNDENSVMSRTQSSSLDASHD